MLADYRRESAARLVNAASFKADAPLAANSIAAFFSEGFAEGMPVPGVGVVDPSHPPSAIAGVQVDLTDSAGVTRSAPLYFVSPQQINLVVPADVAPGQVTVAIRTEGVTPSRGSMIAAAVGPGVFFANFNGQSLAVGQALYASASGQSLAPLVESRGAAPVTLGNGDVYLVLYGTGLRCSTLFLKPSSPVSTRSRWVPCPPRSRAVGPSLYPSKSQARRPTQSRCRFDNTVHASG